MRQHNRVWLVAVILCTLIATRLLLTAGYEDVACCPSCVWRQRQCCCPCKFRPPSDRVIIRNIDFSGSGRRCISKSFPHHVGCICLRGVLKWNALYKSTFSFNTHLLTLNHMVYVVNAGRTAATIN